MVETQDNRPALLIRNAVITVTGLLGVGLLIRLVFVRNYNYDELSHAHMAWLMSVGEVPYRDFAANHFPFLWILVSPLMRALPEGPAALMILRGLALLLNAVFIGALGTLIAWEQHPKERIWAAACFGLVVVSPHVLHYLIEFRPDALANALLFSALLWFRLTRSRNVSIALVCGLGIGVAVLINTKYVLFPFLLGAVTLVVHARQLRQIGRVAVGICLGFGAALLCGLLLLVWMRIPLDDAWRMVVTYNATFEKAHVFGFGLADELTHSYRIWLAYSIVGLIGCVILFLRQRQPPGASAVAILLLLSANLATTTRPWKQYTVPWFLLASYFPARSLPLLAARLGFKTRIAAACCVFIIALAGFAQTGIDDPNGGGVDRATQDRVIEWVTQHVPPNGFVVTSFPLHPVFRRDTFFKVIVDMTNDNGRDGLEQLMPRLAPSPYREHFRQTGYEKELENRPPAVIVLWKLYTEAQLRALSAYLSRHPGSYDQRDIPGTSVTVLERKTGSSSEPR